MSSNQRRVSSITNEEINELPLSSFTGTSIVISKADQLKAIFHEINRHSIVGFDTETRPVFVKGQQHPVALMQIALPNKVFLIRLKYTGLAPEILTFLQEEKILKVGIALRDDIKALQRMKRFKPAGIYELTDLSRQSGLEVEGLKKLTAIVLGFRISKSAQTSNWDAEQLTEKQISYAATDAWACLRIYEKLIPGDW
jgi:ribonuclease D